LAAATAQGPYKVFHLYHGWPTATLTTHRWSTHWWPAATHRRTLRWPTATLTTHELRHQHLQQLGRHLPTARPPARGLSKELLRRICARTAHILERQIRNVVPLLLTETTLPWIHGCHQPNT
tara:strand:- start:49 stop:414 length:366 start_codon:yes stop_codon:yes gene_type:complete